MDERKASEKTKYRPSESTATRRSPVPQSRSSYQNTQRRQIQNARRRQAQKEDSTLKTLLVVFLSVVALVVISLFLVDSFNKKKKAVDLVSWTINTVPNVAKLEFDDQALNEGRYVKSPATLRNLSMGVHKVTVSRPGFETETVRRNFSTASENFESLIELKQKDRMAPLRLALKYAVPPVHFTLDDGLIDDKLSFEKPLNLSYVTFGKEHILIVDISEQSSFSCQFTPRAQTNDAPFLVVVDTSLKKCSYPVR